MSKANKIFLNGETLIDLTQDSVTPETLCKGMTAHDKSGNAIIGTYEASTGGININGIIREYEVNAGANVSAGDFVEFINKIGSGTITDSIKINSLSAHKLDEERVLIALCGSSWVGMAAILKINKNNIAIGPLVTLDSGTVDSVHVCGLTDNTVLVTYHISSSTYYGKAVVLTIDDTSILVGTPITFLSGGSLVSPKWIRAIKIDNNKALLVYTTGVNTTYGKAVVLSIDNTTITVGTAVTFASSHTVSDLYTMTLSEPNRVVLAYGIKNALLDPVYGKAVVLSIDNTTITVGTAVTFASIDVAEISLAKLADNRILALYTDADNSYAGRATVLTVNNTSITVGSSVTFSNGASWPFAYELTDTTALLIYRDNDSDYGIALILTINNSSITVGSGTVFEYEPMKRSTVITQSSDSVLVIGGNKYYSLSIDGTSIILNKGGTFVQKATTNLHNVGVAKTAGAAGEMVEVYCVPVEEQTPSIISFTIDGTAYEAEEGMTWGEWVESEYNPDYDYSPFKKVYTAGSSLYLNDYGSGQPIEASTNDVIIAGYEYALVYIGGGSN